MPAEFQSTLIKPISISGHQPGFI